MKSYRVLTNGSTEFKGKTHYLGLGCSKLKLPTQLIIFLDFRAKY